MLGTWLILNAVWKPLIVNFAEKCPITQLLLIRRLRDSAFSAKKPTNGFHDFSPTHCLYGYKIGLKYDTMQWFRPISWWLLLHRFRSRFNLVSFRQQKWGGSQVLSRTDHHDSDGLAITFTAGGSREEINVAFFVIVYIWLLNVLEKKIDVYQNLRKHYKT